MAIVSPKGTEVVTSTSEIDLPPRVKVRFDANALWWIGITVLVMGLGFVCVQLARLGNSGAPLQAAGGYIIAGTFLFVAGCVMIMFADFSSIRDDFDLRR